MSRKDLLCLCLIVVGIALFLYGSNYFDATVGWVGVYFIIGSLLIEMLLRVYELLRKKRA
jgi:divalent metal cation (Fe/Co/Zn/Cd) transporter